MSYESTVDPEGIEPPRLASEASALPLSHGSAHSTFNACPPVAKARPCTSTNHIPSCEGIPDMPADWHSLDAPSLFSACSKEHVWPAATARSPASLDTRNAEGRLGDPEAASANVWKRRGISRLGVSPADSADFARRALSPRKTRSPSAIRSRKRRFFRSGGST